MTTPELQARSVAELQNLQAELDMALEGDFTGSVETFELMVEARMVKEELRRREREEAARPMTPGQAIQAARERRFPDMEIVTDLRAAAQGKVVYGVRMHGTVRRLKTWSQASAFTCQAWEGEPCCPTGPEFEIFQAMHGGYVVVCSQCGELL
jgi:hypothetical protein